MAMCTNINGALAKALATACNWSGTGRCVATQVFGCGCPFSSRPCEDISSCDWYDLVKNGPIRRYKVQVDVESRAELVMPAFSKEQALQDAINSVTSDIKRYMADNAIYTAKLVEEK